MKKTIALSVSLAMIVAVVSAMTFSVSAAGEEHLIAYYNFEDASNLGKDASGNGNDLLMEGDIISDTGVAPGLTGHSALFNGDSGLYAATGDDGKDFSDKLESYTISFYAETPDGTLQRAISTAPNNWWDCSGGVTVYINIWDLFQGQFTPIPGGNEEPTFGWAKEAHYAYYDMTAMPTINDWNWWVFSYDKETDIFRTYLNGECVTTYSPTSETAVHTMMREQYVFTLGNLWDNVNKILVQTLDPDEGQVRGFFGKLDEVKIYDAAIEIKPIETSVTTAAEEQTANTETAAADVTASEQTTSAAQESAGSETTSDTGTVNDDADDADDESKKINPVIFVIAGVIVVAAAAVTVTVIKKKK